MDSNAPREPGSSGGGAGPSPAIFALTFAETLIRLRTGVAGPLPGPEAHRLLAPRPRRNWPADFNPARIRRAAGLLLVFPLEDRPVIVLTLRADTLGHHGGQVSLPGGVIDPGETFTQAALREAHEEIALAPGHVQVIGALSPLDIPVTGFRLQPIVAAAHAQPRLTPSDREVAKILHVRVSELFEPRNLVTVPRTRDGVAMVVPAFRAGGHEIWGATAMVIAEFLVLLGWSGPAAVS